MVHPFVVFRIVVPGRAGQDHEAELAMKRTVELLQAAGTGLTDLPVDAALEMNVMPGSVDLRIDGQIRGEVLVVRSGARADLGVQLGGRFDKLELPDLVLEVWDPDDHFRSSRTGSFSGCSLRRQ